MVQIHYHLLRLGQKNMTSSKQSPAPYAPLPSGPQNVIVLLPLRRNPSSHRLLRRCLLYSAAVLLLSAAAFLLYPSDPRLRLARLHLNTVRVHSSPPPLALDLSFSLAINVRNRDFFSLDYDSLLVSVGYRGRELGVVTSDGGRVRARGSSYVNATLDLDGIEVIHDVFYFIEDLARGIVPFDTDSTVSGELGFWFFRIPLKAQVSCEVYVNTKNQTIVRQDCYAK